MSRDGCPRCGRQYGHSFYSGDSDALHVLRELGSLSYECASEIAHRFPKAFSMPDELSYSDYSGSTYSESNVRVWAREFEALEGKNWWYAYGGYGTLAILVRTNLATKEQIETIDALADYPILDESDCSELEMDRAQEDWASYGASDFKRELLKSVAEVADDDAREAIETLLDDADDGQLYNLWRALDQDACTEVEQHSTIFRFDDAIKAWEEDPTYTTIENGLLGAPENDARGVLLMLAHADTLVCVRVVREWDYEYTGTGHKRVKAELLETWCDVATREERSNYVVIPNDECGGLSASAE